MKSIINPPIPYLYETTYLLHSQVTIYGKALANWRINFNTSEGDVAMHMKFRFHENVIIFNTKKNGHFEKEERHPIPIQPGDKFLLRFFIEEDKFHIELVDYDKTYDFSQRLTRNEICGFSIDRNVNVYYIHMDI